MASSQAHCDAAAAAAATEAETATTTATEARFAPLGGTHIRLEITSELSVCAFAQEHEFLVNVRLQAPDMGDAAVTTAAAAAATAALGGVGANEGGEGQKQGERAPVSLSAVIDRSGSMAGEKMGLMKATLQYAVANLRRGDEFGLVTFDQGVRVELPLTRMDAEGRRLANHRIDRVTAAGSTNLSAGLFAGLEQLSGVSQATAGPSFEEALQSSGSEQKPCCVGPRILARRQAYAAMRAFLLCMHRQEARGSSRPAAAFLRDTAWGVFGHLRHRSVPAVVLFTDGQANAGLQTTKEITAAMQRMLEPQGRDASVVHTFGFGTDHNEDMLRGIAETGSGGSYFFVDSVAAISTAFSECLGGLLSVVAQKIKVTIECCDEGEGEGEGGGDGGASARFGELMTQFRHEVAPDRRSLTVALVDLCSEEGRDFMFAVRVPALSAPAPAPRPLLRFHVSYYNVLTQQQEESSEVLAIGRPLCGEVAAGAAPLPPAIDRQRNRITCAAALERARAAASQEDARAILAQAGEAISHSPTAADPFCAALLQDLQYCEEELGRSCRSASKMMLSKSMEHRAQRSAGNHSVYTTKVKAAFSEHSPHPGYVFRGLGERPLAPTLKPAAVSSTSRDEDEDEDEDEDGCAPIWPPRGAGGCADTSSPVAARAELPPRWRRLAQTLTRTWTRTAHARDNSAERTESEDEETPRKKPRRKEQPKSE